MPPDPAMICAAHAMLAGAVGAVARSRQRAFLAGIGTHLIGDLLPHRDFCAPLEVVMAAGALAAVGAAAGFDSPAFVGALGGVAPDVENALAAAGLLRRACFPTHRIAHGRRVQGVSSQIALSCIAMGVILLRSRAHGATKQDARPA